MFDAVFDVLKAITIIGFVATIILAISLIMTNMFGVIGVCISLFMIVIFFVLGAKTLGNI